MNKRHVLLKKVTKNPARVDDFSKGHPGWIYMYMLLYMYIYIYICIQTNGGLVRWLQPWESWWSCFGWNHVRRLVFRQKTEVWYAFGGAIWCFIWYGCPVFLLEHVYISNSSSLQMIYADHQKSLELQVELEWSGWGVTGLKLSSKRPDSFLVFFFLGLCITKPYPAYILGELLSENRLLGVGKHPPNKTAHSRVRW